MPDRLYADEWLPSRFSLGTFRLLGYAVARSLERQRPRSGALLNREARQHPMEATLLALAYWMIPAAQLALLAGEACSWRGFVLPLAFAAMLVAVPLAWVGIALLMTPFASMLSARIGKPTHDIQALITPTGMLALAVASVLAGWPGAPLGWLWIGLTIVEIAALLTCLALRRRFAALGLRLQEIDPL